MTSLLSLDPDASVSGSKLSSSWSVVFEGLCRYLREYFHIVTFNVCGRVPVRARIGQALGL